MRFFFFINVVRNSFNQVELLKNPHLLLLQLRNSIFQLPGGRLRPGESGKLLVLLNCVTNLNLLRVIIL